ncbi:hypothetical protein HDU96_005513 [Phlyctochytrium bullatum]|nr:hypothetical protein HDU96_005513 [Phlyctochytrium bullatum]
MMLIRTAALVAVMAAAASAQLCERVIDDMKTTQTRMSKYDLPNAPRYINLLGGDYGVNGGSQLTRIPGGFQVIPKDDAVLAADTDPVHPPPGGDIRAANYFFFKFGWDDDFNVCYDLTPFRYLYVNMSMPPGADGYITFTTKFPNCTTRTLDSTYRKFSDYIRADGTPQLFAIDMSPDGPYGRTWDNSGPNDFQHNKDITFVGLTDGAAFNFYYFSMVGNCSALQASAAGTVNATTIAALPGGQQLTTTLAAATTSAATAVTTSASVAVSSTRSSVATSSAVSSAAPTTGSSAPATTTTTRSSAASDKVGILAAFGAVLGALALF